VLWCGKICRMGFSPNPPHPILPPLHIKHFYIKWWVIVSSTKMLRIGNGPFPRHALDQKVMGSNPMSSKTFTTIIGLPSNNRGHVAPLHFPKKCHLSTSEWICHLPSQTAAMLPRVSMLRHHDIMMMSTLMFFCLLTC
jgi:hypothetical protein